jgi:hypothetical protein
MSRSISSVRSAAWSAVSEKTKTTEGDHARHKCLAQIAGHSLSEAHEAYQLAVSYRSVFASAHTGADGGQHAAIGIASPCNRFASDNERVAGESGRLRARVKDCGRVGDPDERGYVGVLHIVDWTSTCVRVCDCHVTAGLCPMEGNVSPERIGLWRIIQSCTCFASRYAKGFSISARASAISSLSYRRMRQWGARTRRAVRRTDEHDIRSAQDDETEISWRHGVVYFDQFTARSGIVPSDPSFTDHRLQPTSEPTHSHTPRQHHPSPG